MFQLSKSQRHWLIITAILALLLIIFFPLRFAVNISGDRHGLLSAKQVSGTIWSGHITDARIAGLPIGTVDSRLEFWPLLRGRTQLRLERDANGSQPALRVSLGSGKGYFGVRNATGNLPISEIISNTPIKSMEFLDFTSEFLNQKCLSASGKVRAIPDAIIPDLDLQAGLLGKARCERGDLVLALASQSGMEKLELRIKGDGRYSADLMLVGDQNALTTMLTGSGFRAVSGGYRLSQSGRVGTAVPK